MEQSNVLQYILLSGLAPTIAALVPVFVLKNGISARNVKIVLSISAGLLFAIATMDLLPEAVGVGLGLHGPAEHAHAEAPGHEHEETDEEEFPSTKTAMFGLGAGFFLLLCVEHVLNLLGFNHSHAPAHRDADAGRSGGGAQEGGQGAGGGGGAMPVSASFVLVAFAGLGVHSFVDGLVIAGAFRASLTIGLRVAVAIIVHKFPDGFVLSSLVSSSGPTQRKSLYGVVAVLLMTPLGAVIGAFALNQIAPRVLAFVLGFGAGTFIFLSATAILPEILHSKPHRAVDILFIMAGYLLFLFMESLIPGHTH